MPAGSAHAQTVLDEAAAADRELFFQAGFNLLESVADSPEAPKAYRGLLEYPPFLIELTRKDRFSHAKLVRICRKLAVIEKRLDVQLARLLPGRWEDPYELEPEMVTRILDVLNEISMGPRLILLLSHLTSYPDAAVGEKAAILIGRRICNFGWTRRRLESGGPEIRAGVVQALWGLNRPEARLAMRRCQIGKAHV